MPQERSGAGRPGDRRAAAGGRYRGAGGCSSSGASGGYLYPDALGQKPGGVLCRCAAGTGDPGPECPKGKSFGNQRGQNGRFLSGGALQSYAGSGTGRGALLADVRLYRRRFGPAAAGRPPGTALPEPADGSSGGCCRVCGFFGGLQFSAQQDAGASRFGADRGTVRKNGFLGKMPGPAGGRKGGGQFAAAAGPCGGLRARRPRRQRLCRLSAEAVRPAVRAGKRRSIRQRRRHRNDGTPCQGPGIPYRVPGGLQ